MSDSSQGRSVACVVCTAGRAFAGRLIKCEKPHLLKHIPRDCTLQVFLIICINNRRLASYNSVVSQPEQAGWLTTEL